MSKAYHAAGSVANYDIILSITQDTINDQLRLLYDKVIPGPGGSLLPPTATGSKQVKRPKYLINHDLEIHPTDEFGDENPDIGISAHLECPTITFHDVKTPFDYRTARVAFKFRRDESASTPDSRYTITKGGVRYHADLNGYTMSWNVSLGRRDIQDVLAGTY